MGNRVRLHSLIKSSSTNRTFSWMLISHLQLCSCVCPPHHYTSLPLLSSLLTCQPLRSLPSFMPSFVTNSASAEPQCYRRWGCRGLHHISRLGETSWGKQLWPKCGFLIQIKYSNPINIGSSRLRHVFMQPMTRCACLSVHMQTDPCTSSWTSPRLH